ncbi:MAG: YtxH domain-containing protein [Parachlamydiaceae bacterium]|nr:YtxH domain-containing protein [Parachlamydiaceae bacterium]
MNSEEKFFWGAILGSAIGAAAALLFTPLPGRNLRKKIITGLYQPLNVPKRKIFSSKHRRALNKAKTPSHSNVKGKVAKKRASKSSKGETD